MSNPRIAMAGAVIAAVFGAWLRLHGLAAQVVQDDEWHAIHKLMSSGYAEIFRAFGYADHSIPLTLLYKLLADTVGLDEINMRALQAACGIALVPLAAFLAWRVTRHAATTTLLALSIAAAPLLVLYSRVARPYAITTLLVALVCAWLWRWRRERSARTGAGIVIATSAAAWLHPVSAFYPAAGMLFILAEDLSRRPFDARRAAATLALGASCAAGILALLAMPLLNDAQSLSAKAGRDFAGPYTLSRVLSLFAGGFPDAVTAGIVIVAAYGAWRMRHTDRRLALFLAVLFALPMAAVMASGAAWTHQGHTFARYAFPSLVIFLFWAAHGVVALVDPRGTRPAVAAAACLVAGAAYAAFGPALRQVTTLGPWYGHLYHHFDYVPMHNEAARQYAAFDPPVFYGRLARMPAGSATIVEAPFTAGAPSNPMAFFALFHPQRAIPGLIHDLCLEGERRGEVPRDPRFRFRNFVFVDDAAAVRATGARYLVFYREQFHGRRPFLEAERCVGELTRLYGEPVEADPRVVVYDLGRPVR